MAVVSATSIRSSQDMVTTMIRSIGAILSSAAHGVVRGLAVVALVVVWSVSHVGTYALSVVGVSSGALLTLLRAGRAWIKQAESQKREKQRTQEPPMISNERHAMVLRLDHRLHSTILAAGRGEAGGGGGLEQAPIMLVA